MLFLHQIYYNTTAASATYLEPSIERSVVSPGVTAFPFLYQITVGRGLPWGRQMSDRVSPWLIVRSSETDSSQLADTYAVWEIHVLIVKINIQLAKLLELLFCLFNVWWCIEKHIYSMFSLVARLWLNFVFTTLHNVIATLWGKSTMYRFFRHALGFGVHWQHVIKGSMYYFKSSNCFG